MLASPSQMRRPRARPDREEDTVKVIDSRFYHHISHTCLTFEVCSGNQVIGICYENVRDKWGKRENPTSALTKHWIEASVYLNAVFAVLLPVFAVAVLNISLELLIHSVSANPSALQEQERKMTHTVLAIITCFSLTQGPSAIVYMVQKLYQPSSALQIASVVANQLVLTGKMLNVVLFCMTSSTFRRKLLQTCGRWMYTVLYCDRKAGNRSRFSRSQSKSVVTQKTSLVYSPSSRGLRSSIVSEMYTKKPSAAEYSPTDTNRESAQ
ncbi:hypothetical protein NECAME_12303 [Necator americanus]|uniref:G-protein coupled receptors family 1 profile domain-containing protein n=1 Tax=Necator americanus TaxID=51031 RepID=W2T3L4_NECAM|nr:hypothetical protein NECAME_12303 [Necator americanus]ETN75572.1 hypothetical protein NECAME_12303 [Necator americanus]